MFEKYLSLWSKENLLTKAFQRTCKMISYDQEMFGSAVRTLRELNSSQMSIDVYELDRKINKYEREVRRNVLTHLAISGKRDVVPGLSLISIVIDVERIGDYTKNIADLARDHPKKLSGGPYEKLLSDLEAQVTERFLNFERIIMDSDVKLARKIMKSHPNITEGCDRITSGMVKYKGNELTMQNAVALALYARYLKRISSHLTNIASSIVNPFPRIGYREKSIKK